MIKGIPVVLDTNVLVSALWSANGVPAKIVHLIPNGVIVPLFCADILQEYGAVLARPSLKFSHNQIDELMKMFVRYGKLLVPAQSNLPLPDESDRKFYDAAKSGSARLITGNLRHFPDEAFIMSPANFYRYIVKLSME